MDKINEDLKNEHIDSQHSISTLEEKKLEAIKEEKEEELEDYLTVADGSQILPEHKNKYEELYNNSETKVKREKKGFINWVKKLYGFGDEDEEDEDLEFVYSTYASANEKPSRRTNIVFVFVVSVFTLLILWASFAEIDELARGNGKVIPTNKIQTVQSLDGGIVSEILVKEGETVKADAPLMKIDTTRFQATFEESKQEYLALLALKTRLEVESKININRSIPKLKFDKKVLNDDSRYDKNETLLFANRFNELKSSIEVLENQLSQKRQELREIRGNISKLTQKLEFITQQRKTIKRLVKGGVKSSYDLLNIEKEYHETKGNLDIAKLSISRSNYAISEAKNRITAKIDTFKSEASNELQKTLGQINKFEAKMVGEKDRVAKTVLTSPVDGIIKQLNINTIGGVVQSGMDLVEIVPLSDSLVVEAKIDPKDIAFISPSQKAIIKITAYDFSIYGGLDGKIIEISADSIVDKDSKDGKSYYRVLLKTNKNYLEKRGKKLPIIPGMVATVDIVTGKKTILDFLLKPILKVKQDSLHER